MPTSPTGRINDTAVSMRLPSQMVEKLDHIAADRGTRRAKLIRDAVAEWLTSQEGLQDTNPLLDPDELEDI